MKVIDTPFTEVKIIQLDSHPDDRGLFVETWNAEHLNFLNAKPEWVQDCFSLSRQKGTLRGLHFQLPPAEQSKLVRASKGSLYDVVVDVRHGSPTFGHHFSIILRSNEHKQLYVPSGFAHGFCTLEDDTEITYKIAGPYAPELSGGILWNDPDLGIDWPIDEADAILSEKDQAYLPLKTLPAIFDIKP